MSPLPKTNAPGPAGGRSLAKNDLRALEKVRAIFASMSKYISAKTIYTPNNPNIRNFANAFHETFRAYFSIEKELVLAIEQYQIKWRDEVVYDNDQKTESIAFLLYKDGVGEITVHPSVKPDELERFVDLLRNEIYNPSAHLDLVSRLWESEFTNIFYRVFDESADGAPGDGQGSGADTKDEPLRVNDHPGLPLAEETPLRQNAPPDSPTESLGAYFRGIVDRMLPGAPVQAREQRLQDQLEFHFVLRGDELAAWRERFSAADEKDKLLWLLETMLDFLKIRHPPAVDRDIRDIVERLVRHVVEEVHLPTLIAVLDIQKRLAASTSIAMDFQDLPGRMRDELTGTAFLLALGKVAHKSSDDVLLTLRYFASVGKAAVPGVCELLASLKDPSLHEQACDTLIAIVGEDVVRIVNDLNLDNPHEAKDAVYLLRHFMTGDIPPIVKTLATSPDLQVREKAVEYIVQVGSDESARLLCGCLEDGDAGFRLKTLGAMEEFRHPLLADKIISMCFDEDLATRGSDELERMFRTLGKLAADRALPPIRQMTGTKSWLPFGKARAKNHKLLAITALRYIPGEEASHILANLAEDGDNLVRTKAAYAIRQRRTNADSAAEEPSSVASGRV